MPANDLAITIDHTPSDEDAQAVEQGLRAHNARFFGPRDHRPLSFVLRDADGTVRGGLIAETSRGWLSVDTLWIDEALRGKGWGGRLLDMAEQEAVARGCRRALLDAWDGIAAPFYLHRGYHEVGRIRGGVTGYDYVYLVKELVSAS